MTPRRALDGGGRRLTATGWKRCATSSRTPSASPKRRSSTSRTSPERQRLRNLYDSITNRYVFKIEVDGEVKEMTRGELMVYARAP